MSSDLTSAGGGSGITALTGDVTASGSGSQAATIPASRSPHVLRAVTTAQFDRTNQGVAAIPGLIVTVVSGVTYAVVAQLGVAADFNAGYKLYSGGGVGGGAATASYVSIYGRAYDSAGNALSSGLYVSQINGNAIDGVGATDLQITVTGTIVFSSSGTYTMRFGQSTPTPATTSSVFVGSTLILTEI